MKHSIFDRIYLSFLLILILSFAILITFTSISTKKALTSEREETLTNEAQLIASQTLNSYVSGAFDATDVSRLFTYYAEVLNSDIWYVDKNGVITALAKGSAVIEATASDGTSYTIDVEVRPQPALYTLGDVNEDGKIDAKDASAVLVAYSRSSTGADNGLSAAQAKAANVNGDALVDAKDASAILAYYALASTSEGSVPSLEEFLKKD